MAGALWVALVASIAALVSAVLAPVTNWLVATAAHRHERALRVREDKMNAYTSLLRELRRQILVVEYMANGLEGDEPPDDMPQPLHYDMDRWLTESAFTLALLSDEVNAELVEFEKFMRAFKELDASEIDDPDARVGLSIAVDGIKFGMQQRYEGIVDAVRREVAS